jgi:hypothetical protein
MLIIEIILIAGISIVLASMKTGIFPSPGANKTGAFFTYYGIS